jgi:hypothetical protein
MDVNTGEGIVENNATLTEWYNFFTDIGFYLRVLFLQVLFNSALRRENLDKLYEL